MQVRPLTPSTAGAGLSAQVAGAAGLCLQGEAWHAFMSVAKAGKSNAADDENVTFAANVAATAAARLGLTIYCLPKPHTSVLVAPDAQHSCPNSSVIWQIDNILVGEIIILISPSSP